MRKRAGDTLIEVALAVGIFSMVAIAVVAVMNGGTSSTQTALETTLAREEIDTQAEALRFIQSAYIADKDSGTNNSNPNDIDYRGIWKRFQSNGEGTLVIDAEKYEKEFGNSSFGCSAEDYKKEIFKKHAFIINPNNMELITPDSGTVTFAPASTYPRLIASNKEESNLLSDGLVDSTNEQKLSRAEGIYVIAVRDNKTTNITQPNNTDVEPQSAFIDFYIRTCWYGAGEDTPSTIATTIRLYDPDTTSVASKATGVWVEFNPNNRVNQVEVEGKMNDEFVGVNNNAKSTNGFTRRGYDLVGWSINRDSTPSDVRSNKPGTYNTINDYKAPPALAFNDKITLYAIWQTNYFLKYDPNGYNAWHLSDSDCDKYKGCKIPNHTIPDRTGEGYAFKGWCTKKPTANDGSCGGDFYKDGGQYDKPLPMINAARQNDHYYYVTLYAVWEPHYTLYFYDTDEKTVLCKLEKDNVATFAISECGKAPTDKGGGHTFQGWSPNDQEPYYNKTGTYTSFTIPDKDNRTEKLYPVWRVSVKFSSEGWTPQTSDGTESGCAIFNYNVPSGIYKKNGSYYYEYTNNRYNYNKYYYPISAGGRYGDGNTAPANGYIVVGSGKNVEVLDSGIINLQGFCGTCSHGAYRAGVSYAVGKDDTFELSAKMNTNGMHDHPGGHVDISIGPVTATINKTSITSSCKRANGSTTNGLSYSFTSNSVINLRIAKHGNDYDIYVENKKLISCNVTTTKSVQVEYNMIHQDHCCGEIFNTQLYGIEMQQYKK